MAYFCFLLSIFLELLIFGLKSEIVAPRGCGNVPGQAGQGLEQCGMEEGVSAPGTG